MPKGTQRGILGMRTVYASDEDSDYVPPEEEAAAHLPEQDMPLSMRMKNLKRNKQPFSTPANKVPRTEPSSSRGPAKDKDQGATQAKNRVDSARSESGASGDSLPPDMLQIIFKMACAASALPVAATVPCVCRSWRDVAAGMPELWTNLDLSLSNSKATNAIVESCASKGRWREVRHAKVIPRAYFGRNKKVKATLSEAAVLMLAHHCPSITSLDLSGYSFDGVPDFRQEGLESAIANLPSLAHLDISHRVIIPRTQGTDRVVRAALTPRQGQLVSPLVTLHADACPTLARSTVNLLCQRPSAAAQQQQQQQQQQQEGAEGQQPGHIGGTALSMTPPFLHLREVSFNFSGNLSSSMSISPECFQVNAPHLEVYRAIGLGGVFGWQAPEGNWQDAPGWPSLRVLELGAGELQGVPGISTISNNVLLRFAAKSPSLHHLDISGCALPSLRPDVLSHLQGASALRVLRCRRSSLACDAGLQAIAAYCPNLEELDVSTSRGSVSDGGVQALAQACSQLKLLDLAGAAITSEGLRSLLQACPLLWYVELGSCRGLERHLRGCSVAQLRGALLSA